MESLSLTFFWRILSLCLVLAASPAAHATQTMHLPGEYKDAPNALASKMQSKADATQKYIPRNRTSFGYFTNWEDFRMSDSTVVKTNKSFNDDFIDPSDIQTATLTRMFRFSPLPYVT